MIRPIAFRPTRSVLRLSVEVGEDGSLPTEFRLFVAGWNDTENGKYLFDEKAAASVMAAFEAWGVDLMIDLEHQALSSEASTDPTARDARGWCKLELREDGSLWAIAVTWTEDGATRLREKRQRYVSPAFEIDPDTCRVTKIINIAITAIPATHDTPALVAASKRAPRDARAKKKLSTGPSFADISSAIHKAIESSFGYAAWLWDVFDATCVYDVAGKLFEVEYTLNADGTVTLGTTPVQVQRSYIPTASSAPAAPETPAAPATNRAAMKRLAKGKNMDAKKALELVKKGDEKGALAFVEAMLTEAVGGEAPAEEDKPKEEPAENNAAPAGDPPKAKDEEDEDKATRAAARRAIEITGKPTIGEAMAELARRSELAVELASKEAKLATDRAALEATERRALVGNLVRLGVEIPATAWADDKGTVPVKRLADEPIADLRERVKKLSERPNAPKLAPVPPADPGPGSASGGAVGQTVTTPHGVVELSAREVAMLAESKQDVATYAANKAIQQAAKARRTG